MLLMGKLSDSGKACGGSFRGRSRQVLYTTLKASAGI
jgi:hypothetical protein